MEPPYKYIADELNRNQVMPFLGSWASLAGVAIGSPDRLPDGRGLTRELIERYGTYPGFSDVDPLTKVAQYCEECVAGRTPLYDGLRQRFYESQRSIEPSPLAKMLADIPKPLLILTTNYDPYVEAAYRKAGRPFTVLTNVTNREHPKWGYILIQSSTKPDEVTTIEPGSLVLSDYDSDAIIYKIHGTFGEESWSQYDTIIITENDYVDFLVMTELKNFPIAIAAALQRRHILFLGYALEDWNFRVILRKIQLTAKLGQNYRSWAIQLRPSELEASFWQKRNVALHDVDLSEFIQKLKTLLQ